MTKYEKTGIRIGIWLLCVLAVIAIGVHCLREEFPGDSAANSFSAALYATLRLFVFERDIQAFPISWPLTVVYFLAPLMTFSVLSAAVAYVFRITPSLRMHFYRGHMVVCGLRDTGKLLAQSLRKSGMQVIGVEDRDAGQLDDWATENDVLLLHKDFRLRSTLQEARCGRAVGVIFADDDDISNLNLALELLEWIEREKTRYSCRIWAHVADNRLRENTETALKTGQSDRLQLLDVYHLAARKMLESHFSPGQREGITDVLIAGYGALGSDLVESLLRSLLPEENISLCIVDKRDVADDVRHLVSHIGKPLKMTICQRDVRYYLEDGGVKDGTGTAYFLCTDDDPGNLSAAMLVAQKAGVGAKVFVRMQHWPISGVADHFGHARGIMFVNVNELVHEGVCAIPGLVKKEIALTT